MLWKKCIFNSRYWISEHGDIITLAWRNGGVKLLKPQLNHKGYHRVRMCESKGVNKAKYIHRVVYETFFNDKWNPDLQINHIDGNKLNNHISNLEMVTNQENQDHAVKSGLKARGENFSKSKLKEKDIDHIFKLANNGVRNIDIAKTIGINSRTVSQILLFETWTHYSLKKGYKPMRKRKDTRINAKTKDRNLQ
jgi:DNA-binding CsgD family transcriptional regulator